MEDKWVKLQQAGSGPGCRSSHAIAVVGQKAYAFGGEFTPRVPIDNKLHVFDLEKQIWSIPEVKGDVPRPRFGVTMAAIGSIIYVFGGRDLEHKDLNELYSFNTSTNSWSLLSSGELSPPHRSYHSMAADDRQVYIFGGCGNSGRLKDLWAYDVVHGKWVELPPPGDSCRPRGGPGLVVTGGKVWIIYGFSGMELDDVYSFNLISQEWTLVVTSGVKPSPRSVFSSATFGKYVTLYGGEIDPSGQGHLGAGKFSAKVYALDTETNIWKKLKDDANASEHPGPRGWCAFSSAKFDGKEGLLVLGGNSPTNDRLDDIFFFSLAL